MQLTTTISYEWKPLTVPVLWEQIWLTLGSVSPRWRAGSRWGNWCLVAAEWQEILEVLLQYIRIHKVPRVGPRCQLQAKQHSLPGTCRALHWKLLQNAKADVTWSVSWLILWAWYGCPRKSADKIAELWHTAPFTVCNSVWYQLTLWIHNGTMQITK